MRAIFIFTIFSAFFLTSCATVEVAKEVTKATNSIKTSIKKITSNEEDKKITSNEEGLVEMIPDEEKLEENIIIEKKEIIIEKKKEEEVVLKQNKIATVTFVGKTLDELTKQLGKPELLREDESLKQPDLIRKVVEYLYFLMH